MGEGSNCCMGVLSGGVCQEGVGVDLVVYGVFIRGICQGGGGGGRIGLGCFTRGYLPGGREGEIGVRRFKMVDVWMSWG